MTTIYSAIYTPYNLAMKRIRNAETPGESMDAQAAGISELIYLYNTTDNDRVKAEIRRMIGELDSVDHEGDIAASERRACGLEG